MNNSINKSPQFTARTIIKTNNNCLNKDEIKKLTKMGEKIGLQSDTIQFNLLQHNDKIITVSHNAKFNDGRHSLECRQTKNVLINSFKPFEYIQKKMETLKKTYNQTFAQ